MLPATANETDYPAEVVSLSLTRNQIRGFGASWSGWTLDGMDSFSFARFGGAGITFLVGAGVRHFGSLGIPVAMTSIAFALGLLLIPFGAETRGKHLPA